MKTETLITRWSRRKQQAAQAHPSNNHDLENTKDPQDQTIIEPPTEEEQRLEKLNALTDQDMPALETLDNDSDYAGFMSTNVSEHLRKQALKKLFFSDTYQIRDGLDEYDGDYTHFDQLDPSTITADIKHRLEIEAQKRLAQQKENTESPITPDTEEEYQQQAHHSDDNEDTA